MIASFIGTDDKQIEDALRKMQKAFENLGGEEEGFEKINKIDEILMSKSGIGDVYPKITIKNFIDIALPNDINVKGTEFRQQIMKFFDFVLTRENRKLAPLLAKNGTFLGCLKSQFKGDKDAEDIFTYFRKVVGMNNYKKHGGEVGKAEIALALFFGDCKLPDDNGDVVMEMKSGERKIEVKGSKAAITERTLLYKELMNLKWKSLSSQAKNFKGNWGLFPGLSSIRMEKLSINGLDEMVKTILGKGKAKANESKLKNTKNEELPDDNGEEVGNSEPEDEVYATQNRIAAFILLFAGLISLYFMGGTKQHPNGFDTMLIVNTDDDLSVDAANSKLMHSKLVKITKDEISKIQEEIAHSGNGWVDKTIDLLDRLLSQNIDVQFLNRSSQGVFKAMPLTESR